MKKILYSVLALALFASCSENAKQDVELNDAVVTAKIELSSTVDVTPSNSPMRAEAEADVETDGGVSANFPTGVDKISITNVWKGPADVSSTKEYTKESPLTWAALHLGLNEFTATATTKYDFYTNIVDKSTEEYRTFEGRLADATNLWLSTNQVNFTEKEETFHMHMKGLNSMFLFEVNNISTDKTLKISATVGDTEYNAIPTATGHYMLNTVDLVAGVQVQFYATVTQTAGGTSTVIVNKQTLLPANYVIGANKKYSFKNVIKVDDNSFPVSGTFTITWENWDTVDIDNDTPTW